MQRPKCQLGQEAARGLPESNFASICSGCSHVERISIHPGLQMVRLLQFPGSSTGIVCLEATLRPSAALHIWQAYHQANLADASLEMADIWESATAQFIMACRKQAGQPSLLQTAAAIQAADPLAAMFDSNRLGATHALYLPAVPDAVRPLLQLTQVLLSQSGSFMLSCDRSEHQPEFEHSISSTNCIDEAPKGKDVIPDHVAHQERRIMLLQSLLLLLKLLSFLSAVEAKSASTDVAKKVLWQTLADLKVELHSYGEAEADCSGLHPGPASNPASAFSQHWSKTECDVSVPLAALLCTTLRHHILQPTIHADICCRLIQTVLLESSDVIDSQKAQRLAAVFQSKGMSCCSTCTFLSGLCQPFLELCKCTAWESKGIRSVHSSDMLCVFADPHTNFLSPQLHAVCNFETWLLLDAECDRCVCRHLGCSSRGLEIQWGKKKAQGHELGLVAAVLGVIPVLTQHQQSNKHCYPAAHARADEDF